MNINLPTVPPGPLSQTLQTAFQAIKAAFNSATSKDQSSVRVLLQDANAIVWAVSVSTTGIVTTTTVTINGP